MRQRVSKVVRPDPVPVASSPETLPRFKGKRWAKEDFIRETHRLRGELTYHQVRAIHDYQDGLYEAINESLRHGWELSGRVRAAVAALDAAMRKYRLPENVVLYRGFALPEDHPLTRLGVGDRFVDNGYLSTSCNRATANEFVRKNLDSITPVGIVLVVEAPKGTPALPIDAAYTAVFAKEEEVLLPRQSQLIVTGRKERQWNYYTIIEYTVRVVDTPLGKPDGY